jgi:hypothetical protein
MNSISVLFILSVIIVCTLILLFSSFFSNAARSLDESEDPEYELDGATPVAYKINKRLTHDLADAISFSKTFGYEVEPLYKRKEIVVKEQTCGDKTCPSSKFCDLFNDTDTDSNNLHDPETGRCVFFWKKS